MSLLPSTYIGYVDGASNHTQNLASAAWVIFSPTDKLVNSGGICLSLATKNVVEYSEVIELMFKASTLGICHLIVMLESQLVVSHLNAHYSIHYPTQLLGLKNSHFFTTY